MEVSTALLKKRYGYYRKILETKGTLSERQEKTFNQLKLQLGEGNIPKTRRSKLTEEERENYKKKYYQDHREQIVEYNKQWNKKNREKVAEYKRKSNAEKVSRQMKSDLKSSTNQSTASNLTVNEEKN